MDGHPVAAAASVDMHGSHDAAVTLAKAVASTPLPGVPNVGAAEHDFAERARHLGFLAEHAGGVPESQLRSVRSDAAPLEAEWRRQKNWERKRERERQRLRAST
jgi:hypothetical protein